jgi:hypothetical protein
MQMMTPATEKQHVVESSESENEEDDGQCKCEKHFEFKQCNLRQYPIANIFKSSLMESCSHRCTSKEQTTLLAEAKSWDILPNNTKRWCLYFWYAYNVLQIRGCCLPLPHCVETAIKNEYPNPVGVGYTGYKSRAERANNL